MERIFTCRRLRDLWAGRWTRGARPIFPSSPRTRRRPSTSGVWASCDESREEKHSRVTFEIEPAGDVVRLTVTHDRLEPGSTMHQGVVKGWPKVLSSLKSLLETGRPLPSLW